MPSEAADTNAGLPAGKRARTSAAAATHARLPQGGHATLGGEVEPAGSTS